MLDQADLRGGDPAHPGRDQSAVSSVLHEQNSKESPKLKGLLLLAVCCQKFLTYVSAGILAPQSTVENVNEPTLGSALKFESETGSQDIVGALT